MITTQMYKSIISSHGSTLSEIRKNQSDRNINYTFSTSTEYRKAYILTKEGWKWEDVKFFRHVKQSVLADDGDSYLQFRPKTHYPIGTYIIIPDDTGFEINLNSVELQDPFLQDVNKRTQWWIIVNRNNTNYPLYNILKCNWNFKWIYDGKIQESFGCIRNANSYTNGIWGDELSWSLNDINSFWIPDTHLIYGDNLSSLGLYDTRTITHEQRFFITTNTINPDLYMVSKINNTVPKGIIKVTLKSDDLDVARDNIDLLIADYYSQSGQVNIDIESSMHQDEMKTSQIFRMIVDPTGILEVDHPVTETDKEVIRIGESTYYNVIFSDVDVYPEWRIELISDISDKDKDKNYYENLIKITEFDDTTVSIKPSKASSLKGLQFKLIVSNISNEYESYAILEVADE